MALTFNIPRGAQGAMPNIVAASSVGQPGSTPSVTAGIDGGTVTLNFTLPRTIGPAANVENIPAPSVATTAEEVANTLNQLLDALRAAGMISAN